MVSVCTAFGDGWSCDRPIRRNSLCSGHSQQRKKDRTRELRKLRPPRYPKSGLCRASGAGWECSTPVYAGGYCRGHYNRFIKGRELVPFKKKISSSEKIRPDGSIICSDCRRYLPNESFNKSQKGSLGLNNVCKSCHKNRWLLRGYGITLSQYENMFENQGGVCAVCGNPPGDKSLAVDHDHSCCQSSRNTCGKCVRGLLCMDCNHGLGSFKDSYSNLLRAVDYLQNFRSKVDS